MIVIIATVVDFDQFLTTFSKMGVDKRREHGCRGSHVFRDPDDPAVVWIFLCPPTPSTREVSCQTRMPRWEGGSADAALPCSPVPP